MANLTGLPNELIDAILQQISWQDCVSLEQTCRTFHSILSTDSRLWRIAATRPGALSDELLLNGTGNDFVTWSKLCKTQQFVDVEVRKLLKAQKSRTKLSSTADDDAGIDQSHVVRIARFGIQARRELVKHTENAAAIGLLLGIKHCWALQRFHRLGKENIDVLQWFELMDSCSFNHKLDTNLDRALEPLVHVVSKDVEYATMDLRSACELVMQRLNETGSLKARQVTSVRAYGPQFVAMKERYSVNMMAQLFTPVLLLHIFKKLGFEGELRSGTYGVTWVRVIKGQESLLVDVFLSKIYPWEATDHYELFSPQHYSQQFCDLLRFWSYGIRKELACLVMFLHFGTPHGLNKEHLFDFVDKSVVPTFPLERIILQDWIERKL